MAAKVFSGSRIAYNNAEIYLRVKETVKENIYVSVLGHKEHRSV